jgi:uncharacterized protein (DUF2147 family)
MKRFLIPVLLTIMVFFTGMAQDGRDKILGVWFTENKDGKVQVYRVGDKYYGKLIWGKDMFEADGITSKKDKNNSDNSLRDRDIKNLVILSDLSYDDREWAGGKIYDPLSGKTYSCKVKWSENKLDIRGYAGIAIFGRTTIWTKAP